MEQGADYFYILATLFGEQRDRIDPTLSENNRRAWNSLASPSLARAEQIRLWGEGPSILFSLSQQEKDKLAENLSVRSGGKYLALPQFIKDVCFDELQVSNCVDFSGFIFPGDTLMRSCVFDGITIFDDCHFIGRAEVSSSSFRRASFSGIRFLNDANFSRCQFHGESGFQKCKFSDITQFTEASFLSAFSFEDAEFEGYTNFSNTVFSAEVRFINAEFKSKTVFSGAQFDCLVPDFRGAKLHQATEFYDVTWPPPPTDRREALQQVAGYERLKQEMETLKKHEDEQAFFYRELRAKRELMKRRSGEWIINYLYEKSSDYGRSIKKPALDLVIVAVWAFCAYKLDNFIGGGFVDWHTAVRVSVANTFSFISSLKEDSVSKAIANFSLFGYAAGIVQSIVSIILLFLIGLALRSKFRMK